MVTGQAGLAERLEEVALKWGIGPGAGPFTVSQVASILGVGKSYPYEMIALGRLVALRLPTTGRQPRYRVTRRDLLAFLAENETGQALG